MADDLQSNLRLTLASAFERESELTLLVIAFDEWSDDEDVDYFLGSRGRHELHDKLGQVSLETEIQQASEFAVRDFESEYRRPPAVVMTWFIDGQFKVAALTDLVLERVASILPGYINAPVGDDEIEIVRTRLDKDSVPESAWLDD